MQATLCGLIKIRMIRALAAIVLSLGVGFAVHAQPSDAPLGGSGEEAARGSLETLLEILKDDAARADLIAELESAATPAPDAAASQPVEEALSLGRSIALVTQEFAQEAVAMFAAVWAGLSSGHNVFSGLSGDELGILAKAVPELLLSIVITVSVFVALRSLAKRFHSRLGRSAARAGPFITVSLFLASNILDLAVVFLAWALGYVAAIIAVGEFGTIGIRQSMFLNAFLLVESGKVFVRAVLSPSTAGLRLVPVPDRAATTISRSLGLVIGVLGYGNLLVVPIVNRSASMSAGNGVSALLSVFVLIYLIFAVVRHRNEVTNWLSFPGDTTGTAEMQTDERKHPSKPGLAQRLIVALARIWHWIVLVYLGVMFLVVMTQSANVTLNALIASGKILAVLVFASLVSGWLSAAMARGVSLPDDINQKLPLLEPRLNRFVPRAFGTLRLIIMAIVMFFVLDVIGMIDMRVWLESRLGLQITTSIISIMMILSVSFLLWLALTSFVDYRLNPEYGTVPTSREITLLTLMRNAVTIALVILTMMFSLSEIGLDIGPLLASAGVLGLAIGFGAQSLVKDIITGIFIQFESAINVGEVITVGGITGTVEKLSVRSVSLRDGQGVFHIIPFSSVNMVSNAMREFSYAVCDMGIAYRENVEDAKQAMHDAFDLLMENSDLAESVIAPLEWFGITGFGDNAVMLRARIKTVPGKQWAIGRAYNGYLKTVFDERNIEIPFPQQTIWLGQAKDGSTQKFLIDDVSDREKKQSVG